MLMEQTPSSQNWQPVNALKRPGVLRLWSYLAVAHGADTVMYFQWRRGRGGCEMFHGAVVEHGGTSSTRVFREVSELGAELERLGSAVIGGRTPARVAVMFDWNNWWAIDTAVGPIQDKQYVATVRRWYCVWVEEIDALYEGQTNRIVFADGSGSFACSRLCEVVRPETADVLATYGDDFYGGTPVVTRNQFGAGCAYYVATDPEDAFLDEFAKRLLAERRIEPPLEAPPGLEVALRERDAHTVLFLLNHSTEMAQVELPVDAQYRDLLREMPVAGTVALEPRDVRILVHLQ